MFIKALWHHDSLEYPIELYSEIGEDGFEIRKVEVYANGTYGFANSQSHSSTTQLGEKPIPSVAEINKDSQFHATEIAQSEFEVIWAKATPAD